MSNNKTMENNGNSSFSRDDHTLIMNSEHGTSEDLQIFEVASPKVDKQNYKIEDKVFKDFTTTWVYTPKMPLTVQYLRNNFLEAAKAQHFELENKREGEILAVFKPKEGIKETIMKLIPCMTAPGATSFRFKYSSDGEFVKKFEFEGISGSPRLILLTFEGLKKKIQGGRMVDKLESNGSVTVEKRIMALKTNPNSSKNTKRKSLEYQPLKPGNGIEMSEEKEADLQGNKIVEINRMLADSQYSVGRQIKEFSDKLSRTLEDDEGFLKPVTYVDLLLIKMNQLTNFIRSIQDVLAAPGNLGSDKMKKWVPLSNQVVEKFIFQSVYEKLFDKFQKKYCDQDKVFFNTVLQMRDFSDSELLDNLEVKPKFRFGNKDGQYIDSIIELEKIQYCQTPKDKLECIVMANSEMRSAVIKHHHAKTEIESMDEELPITIFIVSRVKCRQLVSNLQFVRSYLQSKDESDHQERMVANILVSVDYISKEWKLSEIKKNKESQE